MGAGPEAWPTLTWLTSNCVAQAISDTGGHEESPAHSHPVSQALRRHPFISTLSFTGWVQVPAGTPSIRWDALWALGHRAWVNGPSEGWEPQCAWQSAPELVPMPGRIREAGAGGGLRVCLCVWGGGGAGLGRLCRGLSRPRMCVCWSEPLCVLAHATPTAPLSHVSPWRTLSTKYKDDSLAHPRTESSPGPAPSLCPPRAPPRLPLFSPLPLGSPRSLSQVLVCHFGGHP